jgi:hypothetical protein
MAFNSQRIGFDSMAVGRGIVVDSVPPEQVLSATSVSCCQYRSTNAPHISMYLPLFPAVSIVPPMLHTQACIYH